VLVVYPGDALPWIPPRGRKRPLEVAALEDKIVQHAYEEEWRALKSGAFSRLRFLLLWTKSTSGSSGTVQAKPIWPGQQAKPGTDRLVLQAMKPTDACVDGTPRLHGFKSINGIPRQARCQLCCVPSACRGCLSHQVRPKYCVRRDPDGRGSGQRLGCVWWRSRRTGFRGRMTFRRNNKNHDPSRPMPAT
jgi:hypothetical protein